MSTYIKIIHVFISIVAALTVGVLLAVFIGLATMIDSFLKFPVQEGMWEKHIRRMEGKKKKEQELKQQIEANSPYNDGWTKDFYQKQIDEDE